MELNESSLTIPVGTKVISVDMSQAYLADTRLPEVAMVTAANANELASFFNIACSNVSKAISLLQFEEIVAKKEYALAKATVMLDKAPAESIKVKELGFKPNEDWRAALIVRDEDCQRWQTVVDQIEAAKSFLNTKLKTFERAYYTCYKEKDRKGFVPDSKIMTSIGETYNQPVNLMGATSVDEDIIAAYRRIK